MNRTDRLMAIILLLRTREKLTARQLADVFGVSLRTIYRDIDALSQANVPIAVELGPEGGYSLLETYSLPPVMFSLDEATALFLGGNLVAHLEGTPFQEGIKTALIKIEDILPAPLRGSLRISAESILFDMPSPGFSPVDTHVFETINQAILKRKCVHFTYYSYWRDEATERLVAPYSLIYDHRYGIWYLVGHCHLRDAQRMFRVGHIQEITLTDRDFQVPEEFELQRLAERGWAESLVESWKQEQPRIRLRVSRDASERLRHHWLLRYAEREELPDGQVILTYHSDYAQVLDTLRHLGTDGEVLEPAELRELVVEQAQKVLALYGAS